MITQEELKESISYDPETGVFTWLKTRCGRALAGSECGSLHSLGYIIITIDKERYFSHRLSFLYMTGAFPENDTDHINGIRHDNRWVNLRSVTRSENLKNRKLSSNSTSGVNGVHFNKGCEKWEVKIRVDGKRKGLGYYFDFDEAVRVRKAADVKYGYHENHGSIPLFEY